MQKFAHLLVPRRCSSSTPFSKAFWLVRGKRKKNAGSGGQAEPAESARRASEREAAERESSHSHFAFVFALRCWGAVR